MTSTLLTPPPTREAPEDSGPPHGDEPQDNQLGASLRTSQQRSERVKLRRGLAFLGMTLVLPGSAQLTAGNRRVGRFALRIWIGLWVLLALVGLLALVWRSGLIAVFAYGPTLRVVQVGLLVLAAGWALLLLDAWRISRPPELARRHRLGFAALSLLLVAAVVGGLVASASVVSAQRELVQTVFAGGGETKVQAGRFNVLLMGGDAGPDRTGLRPDSMTIASIDAETGRTVLIGLPRNLEGVPFPASSPMHKKFPKGYSCKDHSCMLNAVYTYAMGHKNLYPHVKNPGAQATVEAAEGVTGLKINYWALIDLKGFADLIDAVGGITMDVYRRVPIGGGPHAKLYGYVEAGKNRHLDGREALWFARSRSDSSDYDRMVRQKCVMNAMLKQLDPVTVLTKFNAIASAGKEVVATDIPSSKINTMLELAMKAKKVPISSVNIVPPMIYPGDPDFPKVRKAVAAKVAKAEDLDAKAVAASASPTAGAPSVSASPAAKKKTAAKKGKGGANTNNLGAVCSG